MEGSRRRSRRKVVRCHETSRLEDDLWVLAYDQICPPVSRAGKRRPVVRPSKPGFPATDLSPIARSA
jgi:hypothetical protein